MTPIPQDVESLIKELESFYPPRCIVPNDRLEDALFYSGQVELVQALRLRFDWTRERAKNPKENLNVLRRQ